MVPDAAPPVLGRVACPLTFSLPGTAPRNFSPSSPTVGSRPTWGRRAWDVPVPPEQLSPRSQRAAHSLELTVVSADLATACNGADGIAAPTSPVRSLRVGGRRHLPQGPRAPEPAARGLSLLTPAPQPLPLPGARPPIPAPRPPTPLYPAAKEGRHQQTLEPGTVRGRAKGGGPAALGQPAAQTAPHSPQPARAVSLQGHGILAQPVRQPVTVGGRDLLVLVHLPPRLPRQSPSELPARPARPAVPWSEQHGGGATC